MFTSIVIKAHHRLCKKINRDKRPVRDSSITVRCYKWGDDISITNIKGHA